MNERETCSCCGGDLPLGSENKDQYLSRPEEKPNMNFIIRYNQTRTYHDVWFTDGLHSGYNGELFNCSTREQAMAEQRRRMDVYGWQGTVELRESV